MDWFERRPRAFFNTIKISTTVICTVVGTLAVSAHADVSVDWLSPADGSSYPAGSTQVLTGVAGAEGSLGSGLDLVLVLDSSGSMAGYVDSAGSGCYSSTEPSCKPLQQWQAEASSTLVGSLPHGTAVGIVEFDSNANLVTGLTTLTSDRSLIYTAINSVDASGSTYIGRGIDLAVAELTGPQHTNGNAQHIIVFSDGESSGYPLASAEAALKAGVEAVHSIALPGASLATVKGIAEYGNGSFIDATEGFGALLNIFSGIDGNLVELEKLEVTLADGSLLEIAADAFGNFDLNVLLESGANTFVATAYGTDGSIAQDTITLNGLDDAIPTDVTPVPLPGSLPLLLSALFGFIGIRRKLTKR